MTAAPIAPSPATLAEPAPAAAAGSSLSPSLSPSIKELVADSGLSRVHFLAWRDLDDPEAGGSELHADHIAARWADAGLDVTMRTSTAAGHLPYGKRHGYSVIRKAGRYSVFPRTALSGAVGRTGPRDALVEIWNGMPFFSPVWARVPRIVFLHHVHAEMWRMALTPRLAAIGETVEFKIAPPFYRRTRIVTLSESSKGEIVELLGLPEKNVTVVVPGIDGRYSPAPAERSPHPLVVAVGRLVPVKRFTQLVDALLRLRAEHPTLEAQIVGEGYERPELERLVAAAGAQDWLHLPGRVSDDDLLALYRRAWVLTSSSAREGWGMTITEAAACGTPAVVTDIAGHADAIDRGVSGLLVPEPSDLRDALSSVLGDAALRSRLSAGAIEHAAGFTWERAARDTFSVLADEARRKRR